MFRKEFEFQEWADRQWVDADGKQALLKMLESLPTELKDFLAPRWTDADVYFTLSEVVLVARKV
ncbi:MAG: hypothetical protein ACRDD1_00075 [Planctomycetia bacterium]